MYSACVFFYSVLIVDRPTNENSVCFPLLFSFVRGIWPIQRSKIICKSDHNLPGKEMKLKRRAFQLLAHSVRIRGYNLGSKLAKFSRASRFRQVFSLLPDPFTYLIMFRSYLVTGNELGNATDIGRPLEPSVFNGVCAKFRVDQERRCLNLSRGCNVKSSFFKKCFWVSGYLDTSTQTFAPLLDNSTPTLALLLAQRSHSERKKRRRT